VSTPSAAARRDQQVQEDLVRLDAYRGQLNAMLQQQQFLLSSRADHLRARESLEGFERSGDAPELLIPLGGEAFVRGQTVRSDRILLGIGSGVVTEMERPKAAEILSQRLDKIDQAARDLEGQMRTLEERIAGLSDRLDQLTRGPEAGPGEGGRNDVVGD
jgi:prefoldin alpha subunit